MNHIHSVSAGYTTSIAVASFVMVVEFPVRHSDICHPEIAARHLASGNHRARGKAKTGSEHKASATARPAPDSQPQVGPIRRWLKRHR